MIHFERVTFAYSEDGEPVLHDVSFDVGEGELVLVIGRTGSGKSTLLSCVNGLAPHFTGGVLRGEVRVATRSTRSHKPRDLADLVGYVGQDPLSSFVTDAVEEELAFSMEQLGLSAGVMRRRVEEVLDLLGLDALRDRPLLTLSGGERQRVAIGSVLCAHPRVLVLDEPTSALDPLGAEEVLAAITRLVHDLGITVILAEHRLERVVHAADRVLELRGDGTIRIGTPSQILRDASVAPALVELSRLLGVDEIPLSVRDARRATASVRVDLERTASPRIRTVHDEPVLEASKVVVRHGATEAVRGLDLTLNSGEVCALMGRNGSGKSSLLWALHGAGPRQGGSVLIDGVDPARRPSASARSLVCLVPQEPADLLFNETVGAELADASRRVEHIVGASGARDARALLDQLAPGVSDESHPRDLSEGQRLALVLAIQLVGTPRVVLLDEPTRGLDYDAKRILAAALDSLARRGSTVLVATHDVEFVAGVADRVLVMAGGELIADGACDEVVVGSPTFAPQISKVFAPLGLLDVNDVADALGHSAR